jgi:CRP-like cAMP-binding protein
MKGEVRFQTSDEVVFAVYKKGAMFGDMEILF